MAALSSSQMMELWLGPNDNFGSLFADRDELRAAWEEHRAEAMALWAKDGHRPMAWWQFDAPAALKAQFDDDHEQSILWRAGIVTGEEREELEAEWRSEFERAYALGYNAKQRREHYAWADIPRELVKVWTTERKRSAKTIKKLATEASEPAPSVRATG